VVFPDLRRFDAYLDKDATTTLRGGGAHAHGSLRASLVTRRATGHLAVAADGVAVHTKSDDVRGSAAGDVVLVGLDLDSGKADLSGSHFGARDVVLASTPSQPPWWGNVELSSSHLSFGELLFRTKLAMQAKDGRPLLVQAVPAWMANLIGLDGLQGEAAVAVGASRLDVTGFHIKGQGGDVRGELHQRGASSRGMALAEAGLLVVGVELQNGSTSVKLVGAKDWYEHATTPAAPAAAAPATTTIATTKTHP
jgi:hypothetical protein